MKKTRIMFFSYPEFSGNSKYLYDYMYNNYKNKYELVWYCSHDDNEDIYISNNLKYIKYDDVDLTEFMEKVDIIFDTHGIAINFDLSNIIYVNLWHGIGPKKAGFLIDEKEINSFDLEYSKKMSVNTDYFITPSEFWNYIHGQLFDTNHHRMLKLGSLRNEVLLKSNKKLKETKGFDKVLFYLPTFRSNGNRNDGDNTFGMDLINIEGFKEKEFLDYLDKNNILLVTRFHPSEKIDYKKLNNKNIFNLTNDVLNEKKLDLYEILNNADVLITDYSSVYFDYYVLNKPVIFIHSDKKTYAEKRGYIFDNYEFWFKGYIPNNYKELVKTIESLKNEDEEKIKEREFNNIFFLGEDYQKYNYNVAERIYNYFFDNKFQLKENIEKNYVKILKRQNIIFEEKNNQISYQNLELKSQIKDIKNSRGYKLLEEIRLLKKKLRLKK